MHPRYRTPHAAIIFILSVSAAIILAAGLALGPFNGFLYLIDVSTAALFIGHMLGDVALLFFYRKQGEFDAVLQALSPWRPL